MTHAIVTTVDGPYSGYMPEWAQAVAGLDRQPDQVVIVDNGADDPDAVDRAATVTGAEVVRTPWHLHRARARNIAVATSRTDWVQHLDVDDLPEPWALTDTDALRDQADVISWGWTRFSDDGRRPRGAPERLYTAHRGEWTLKSKAPASAVSPFRRRLWETAPYREDMDGSWDTALWIGFAHLDARFVPTARPCYRYRYHRDSLFQGRPATDKRRLGWRLEQLRWIPPADVAVVVPLRTDDPDRITAADWLERWYQRHFPDWRWVVADCDGPWNKPRALNRTVAGLDVRTLVVTDGDLFVDPDNLEQAVELSSHVPWVVPHETVHRLDRDASRAVMSLSRSEPDPSRCVMKPYRGVDGGGIFVLSKAQWDRAGGMDESFDGWGCEDEAFAFAANTLLGDRVRLDGPLWHLYHDPGPRTRHDRFPANKARLRSYRAAAGNRGAMRALTGEITMAGEVRYLNTRTNKSVKVEVGTAAWARFERLVAHGRVYTRIDGPAPDEVETDDTPEPGQVSTTLQAGEQVIPPGGGEVEFDGDGPDTSNIEDPTDVEPDTPTIDQAPDSDDTHGGESDRHIRHTGAGWYELVVDGEVVGKVRGKADAQAALAAA